MNGNIYSERLIRSYTVCGSWIKNFSVFGTTLTLSIVVKASFPATQINSGLQVVFLAKLLPITLARSQCFLNPLPNRNIVLVKDSRTTYLKQLWSHL
jgi:hypothetical protein